jgi:hypothetical protein
VRARRPVRPARSTERRSERIHGTGGDYHEAVRRAHTGILERRESPVAFPPTRCYTSQICTDAAVDLSDAVDEAGE